MADLKLSSAAQKALGLNPNTKFYSPFPFAGVNLSASGPAIDDKQFRYLENFVKAGDGYLRTAWDVGPFVFSRPPSFAPIISFFSFNIGAVDYFAVFFADGTAVQVSYPSGTVTPIAAAGGTFTQAGFGPPTCTPWGSQYLIIANNHNENAYFIWDGVTLYQSGGISPAITIEDAGSGYSSTPTVTAFGGHGSGIVVTPVIVAGSVVALNVDNPGSGYLPGDIIQFAFSGGGSDSSAILEAVLAKGTVGSVEILSGGSSFTPGTYALSFSGGGGSDAAGTYTVGSDGSVDSAAITDGGSGYTSAPTVSFSSGGGSGATGQAIIASAKVASVNVIQGGTNFSSTPTLNFVGGGGSGATAVANLSGGSIASVHVSNGGSGYDDAPAVEVEIGVNNAAAAIADLMPFGVSGNSIETFQSRVWLFYPFQPPGQVTSNGGVFQVSAPNSLTDFATSDGGLVFTSTDRFLKKQYMNVRQSNGYLYPLGDSSISVISNVQTGGSPTTTTFSYQNVDPQVGVAWRDTVQDFGTTILGANPLGIFGVYGGRALKVSKDIDQLFVPEEGPNLPSIILPSAGGLVPSSAVATLFNQKHYICLFTASVAAGPFATPPRPIMVAWDEKEWRILSQSAELIYIGTQEIDSQLTAWGTDGTNLFPLFAQPSTRLPKVLSTKFYGATQDYIVKDVIGFYLQAQDRSAAQVGISGAVTIDVNGVEPQPEDIDGIGVSVQSLSVAGLIEQPAFAGEPPFWPIFAVGTEGVPGVNVSATLSTLAPDFAISNIMISYYDQVGIGA